MLLLAAAAHYPRFALALPGRFACPCLLRMASADIFSLHLGRFPHGHFSSSTDLNRASLKRLREHLCLPLYGGMNEKNGVAIAPGVGPTVLPLQSVRLFLGAKQYQYYPAIKLPISTSVFFRSSS